MYLNFFIFLVIIEFSSINNNILPLNIKNSINNNNIYKQDFNLRILDNKKKNLIMGIIVGYPWAKIELYFTSLFKSGYKNYDIVMFIAFMSQRTTEKLKSFGVIALQIPDKYIKSKYKCANYRFLLYREYLIENQEKYNMVLLTDVRDTYFQRDIFQFYENKKSFLAVFLEEGNLTEKTNKDWLLKFMEQNEYDTIANKTIICSGTILGTTDKIIEISLGIWEITKVKIKIADQAALNYLIYYKKLINENELIFNDNHGPLMTIGIPRRKNIALDNETNILNYNGEIAAVIHQYDRHKYFVEKMMEKYLNLNMISFTPNNQTENSLNDKKGLKDFIALKETKYKILLLFAIIIAGSLLVYYFLYLLVNKIKKEHQKKKRKFKKVKIVSSFKQKKFFIW